MTGNDSHGAAHHTALQKKLGATDVVLRLRRPQCPRKLSEPISREAQRFAAAILDVLAGVRTPSDAAKVMGITLARYYTWEHRALIGLVLGCEPHATGRIPGAQHQIAVLEKQVTQLKQESARHQALARAAQRTLGLTPPSPPIARTGGKATDKKSRQRRPVVRALKAAAEIRAAPCADQGMTASGTQPAEVLQQGGCGADVSSPSAAAIEV